MGKQAGSRRTFLMINHFSRFSPNQPGPDALSISGAIWNSMALLISHLTLIHPLRSPDVVFHPFRSNYPKYQLRWNGMPVSDASGVLIWAWGIPSFEIQQTEWFLEKSWLHTRLQPISGFFRRLIAYHIKAEIIFINCLHHDHDAFKLKQFRTWSRLV